MYLQNNTKLKVEDKERNGKRNNNYLIKYCISGRFYTMVSKDQYNPYIYTYTLTIQKLLFSSIDNFFLSRLKGNNIMLKNLSCTCMCPSSCTNKQTKLQFNSL